MYLRLMVFPLKILIVEIEQMMLYAFVNEHFEHHVLQDCLKPFDNYHLFDNDLHQLNKNETNQYFNYK